MRWVWLPEAQGDVRRRFDFLLEKDPSAAERAVRAIQGSADRLLEFPAIGRPMDDDTGRRELSIPFGASAYVLRHRIHDDMIVILRVWHSR